MVGLLTGRRRWQAANRVRAAGDHAGDDRVLVFIAAAAAHDLAEHREGVLAL